MRRRMRGRRGIAAAPKVKMTSMMDILTVLLLFLLKSFVVDAGITTPPPDVRLPQSTSQDVPEMSLVVAVSGDAILVGDHPVTTVKRALTGSDLLIPELEAELGRELDRMDEVAAQRGGGGFDGQITIQGDKDVEFKLLQRVMYTCNTAGADRMALAVVKGSS